MAQRGYADGVIELPWRIVGPGSFLGTATTVQLDTARPDPAVQLDATPGDGESNRYWELMDGVAAGSVLVVAAESTDITALGGVTAAVAKARGLAGVLTNGSIRDTDEIGGYGLTVHHCDTTPRRGRGVCTGVKIDVRIGNIIVRPGDLIVADGDGVVRVPRAQIDAVMPRAYEIEHLERAWADYGRAQRSISRSYEIVAREFGSPH